MYNTLTHILTHLLIHTHTSINIMVERRILLRRYSRWFRFSDVLCFGYNSDADAYGCVRLCFSSVPFVPFCPVQNSQRFKYLFTFINNSYYVCTHGTWNREQVEKTNKKKQQLFNNAFIDRTESTVWMVLQKLYMHMCVFAHLNMWQSKKWLMFVYAYYWLGILWGKLLISSIH